MKLVFSFLKKGWVLTVLISFFILNHFYYDVLFAPNKHTFNSSGDGLKNYYTSAYFIKNNKSLTSFEGMNYPYGESIMYTDGHPALSYILKTLSVVIPDIDTNVIGILNLIMLLGIILTAFILYRIFERLKFHPYFAVFSAIGLTFLAPQIFRIQGHYSLSHSFCIPLTLLILLKSTDEKGKISNYVWLLLNNVFWFFTHPYLGLMTAGITALHGIIGMLSNIKSIQKTDKKHLLLLSLSGVLSVIIFLVFSAVIDNHEFRPTNPYGIHEFYATFESVFLPSRAPFNSNFKDFYEYEGTSWEGVSYIGIVSLIVLSLFIMRSIKLSFQNSKVIVFNDWLKNQDLKTLMISALLFLMFSMLLPFRWGFEDAVDSISFIKQFRSLGRFAWVFYFILGISVLYIINNYIQNLFSKNKTKWAYAILIGAPILYLFESSAYHREVSESISKSDNLFRLKRSSQEIKDAVNFIKPDKYQAIIPLPYYHVGSDNYGKGSSDKSQQLSMVLSFQTGLPLLSSHLARTSIKETKDLFQLFSEPHFHKNISESIENDLPLLILHSKEYLSPNEISLLDRSEKISENSQFTLYKISKQVLLNSTANTEKKRFKNKQNLYKKGDYWVSDTNKFFFHKSLDSDAQDTSYINKGHKIKGKDYNVYFESANNTLPNDREYESSVWVWTGGKEDYYGQDNLNYRFFLEEQINGKADWVKVISPSQSMTIDGDWSQLKFRFWKKSEASYKIFLFGDTNSKMEIYADEFLLRETNLDLYEDRNGQVIKNTQIIH